MGNLEEHVAAVDELMKDGKIEFLRDYTAQKQKEEKHHVKNPEIA